MLLTLFASAEGASLAASTPSRRRRVSRCRWTRPGEPVSPTAPDDVALAEEGARADSGRRRLHVSEEHQIVPQAARLAHGVAGHYGDSEEGSDVDDLGGALLVLQRNEADGGPSRFDQVDGSMANLPEARSAALLLVASIEVVSAHDARVRLARNWIAVGVVSGGTVRTSRDLVVDHPPSQRIAVCVHGAFEGGCAVVFIPLTRSRNVDTSVPIGKRATWTDRARVRRRVRRLVCGRSAHAYRARVGSGACRWGRRGGSAKRKYRGERYGAGDAGRAGERALHDARLTLD